MVATAALSALVILPQVYSKREALRCPAGAALAYEFRARKLGSGGLLDVELDWGETIRRRSERVREPGDRICVRATRRGTLIEGYLVAMERRSSD